MITINSTGRLGIAAALLLLAASCVPEKKPRAPAKTTAQQQAVKSSSRMPARHVKLELPELTKPAARPAARVVHLLYTSNVDGELDPCG